jgi:hypothetical protein
MIEAQPPQGEQPSTYLPAGPPDPLIFEDFEGMDTSALRPGVDDKKAAWLDGFMPLAKRNLRTMYGIAPALFTATGGDRVVFFDFFNIGATPYCLTVVSTGEIYATNTNTKVTTSIAPDGTITNPTRTQVGLTQYGSKYVLIVANQPNGYWIWDGTTFYGPGGIGPVVTITNGGSGYAVPPSISFSGGGGSGITAVTTITNGVLTGVQITNPGTGYTSVPTVNFSPGVAAATVALMPKGIQGTTIEVYSGRVWIGNGATVTFSAPGAVTDFSSANGGGNFTSSDSFLRVAFIQLKQTNGFLYLIGDSSVNYISGVQTSGSPPVTTFTNQNSDPEVGTPWPATVDVFSRNILFANPFGAQVSYGGAVTKISEPLDGVYNTVPNFGNITPSAGKAILFGKKCWILLLPIIDPVKGQQVNKLLLMREPVGKIWWASEQDVPLTYIQHQEINSVLTCYGTDGISIYQLFAQPSTVFTKTAQTKLWDKPGGYQFTKFMTRLWGIVKYYSSSSPNLNISLDNELNSVSIAATVTPNISTWVTLGGLVSTWLTAGALPSTWLAGGGTAYSVLAPDAVAQQGILTGFTVTTNAADMAIVSMMMQDTIAGYRG